MRLVHLLSVFLLITGRAFAAVWYVDAETPALAAGQNGESWATAFETVQEGVNAATGDGGGEVWVAQGRYTDTTDPVVTMQDNVSLYGGFAGHGTGGAETTRDERAWRRNLTIIDGEGVRRCFVGANNATVDGFVATRGYGTHADGTGGGLHIEGTSPTVANCVFVGNSTTGWGGGLRNNSGLPVIVNCLVAGNRADINAGGMYNGGTYDGSMYVGGDSIITNCTFAENTTGGMSNWYCSPTITNCILWGEFALTGYTTSPVVTHSDVEGGASGTNNLNTDPLFVTGPSGVSTGLVYDPGSAESVLTHTGAGMTADAWLGHVLWIGLPEDRLAYVITGNDAETITVLGDATLGATIGPVVSYEVVTYQLAHGCPCIDVGRDASGASYGSVTHALNGLVRGEDGRGDGPTGVADGGDGSDFDMGAFEYSPLAITTDGGNGAGMDFGTIDPALHLDGTCSTTVAEILVNGSASGVSYVVGSSVWSFETTLAEGDNAFDVTALDGTGQTMGSTSITVEYSGPPPGAPVILNNNGEDYATNEVALTLWGSCETDVVEIRVNGSTDGVLFTPGFPLWSYSVDLAGGDNSFSITALDGFGQESAASTITVTRDRVRPQVASAEAVDASTVRVAFSEAMLDDGELVKPANYTFSGGGDALAAIAVVRVDSTHVDVLTNAITSGATYTVSVATASPVDLAGNHIHPDYDSAEFTRGQAGDVDGSGSIDAIDVQLVINAALGIDTGYNCDVNNDGATNAVDVQLVINAALGIS